MEWPHWCKENKFTDYIKLKLFNAYHNFIFQAKPRIFSISFSFTERNVSKISCLSWNSWLYRPTRILLCLIVHVTYNTLCVPVNLFDITKCIRLFWIRFWKKRRCAAHPIYNLNSTTKLFTLSRVLLAFYPSHLILLELLSISVIVVPSIFHLSSTSTEL